MSEVEKQARQASRRKYHYIYKITREDGKYYLGMHSTDNLEDGYFGSGKRLKYSINKHGLDKHVKEIIEYFPCRDTLKTRERELINEECLLDHMCMNIRLGGEGGEGGGGFSVASRRKGQDVLQERRLIDNSKASLGFKNFIKAGQIALKKSLVDRWSTQYNKMKEQAKSGITAMASETSNRKRKETFAKIKHQQGENHSQFGTCWVMKDGKSIKIKKELLEEYLSNGYSKGRKIK